MQLTAPRQIAFPSEGSRTRTSFSRPATAAQAGPQQLRQALHFVGAWRSQRVHDAWLKADLRSSKCTKLRVRALKIVNVASFCRNFKKVADHEGVLQSLQILQQRDKRPRIIKDRACHRHCPLIATRAVAPPAARIINAGFGISPIENPRRGRRYSSGA